MAPSGQRSRAGGVAVGVWRLGWGLFKNAFPVRFSTKGVSAWSMRPASDPTGRARKASPSPRPSLGGCAPTAPGPPAPDRDGFIVKKRKWGQPPLSTGPVRTAVRAGCAGSPTASASTPAGRIDFCFENPLDGKFKNLQCVQELMASHPGRVHARETSYCHYGCKWRKRTFFLSTLSTFRPTPACPRVPCANVSKHTMSVAGLNSAEKNSLPAALVDQLLESWVDKHSGCAKEYLLIDVFSGWGSVGGRVHANRHRWPTMYVYSNDIVRREHVQANLDMRAGCIWTPASLLVIALELYWPEGSEERNLHPGGCIGWAKQNGIAVLFHASTPCDTYSTQGLGIHRRGGSASTEKAREADAMNAALIRYFSNIAL